eukprot:snap_masked-scaffold_10-processed-gene-6.10-mRNA-1 protein AED:1.00 eAED:1.00 QI:0/-1/0/0/-1/1/1/0/59
MGKEVEYTPINSQVLNRFLYSTNLKRGKSIAGNFANLYVVEDLSSRAKVLCVNPVLSSF